MRAPAPKHLSQASEDGAPFWSSGDQKAIRYSPQEMELPKEGTFQPSSSQVFKVKALRILGRSGQGGVGGVAMLCPNPHSASLTELPLEPGMSIKTEARTWPPPLVLNGELWRALSPQPLAWEGVDGGGAWGGAGDRLWVGSEA